MKKAGYLVLAAFVVLLVAGTLPSHNSFAEGTWEKIKKKTKSTAQVTKLKLKRGKYYEKIDDTYKDLGAYIYNKLDLRDLIEKDRKAKNYTEKIDVYFKKIEKIKEKIDELQAGGEVSDDEIDDIDEGVGISDESEADADLDADVSEDEEFEEDQETTTDDQEADTSSDSEDSDTSTPDESASDQDRE